MPKRLDAHACKLVAGMPKVVSVHAYLPVEHKQQHSRFPQLLTHLRAALP